MSRVKATTTVRQHDAPSVHAALGRSKPAFVESSVAGRGAFAIEQRLLELSLVLLVEDGVVEARGPDQRVVQDAAGEEDLRWRWGLASR